MIYGVYSIRDMVAGTFMSPTIDTNDNCAKRNFEQIATATRGMVNFRPSDFSLYKVADFDVETGLMIPITPVELIMSGDSIEVKSNEV